MNFDEIFSRYARRGAADPREECVLAARDGRLWEVDTQNSGNDALVVASSAEDAVAIVAASVESENFERWSARRVEV